MVRIPTISISKIIVPRIELGGSKRKITSDHPYDSIGNWLWDDGGCILWDDNSVIAL